MFGTIDKSKGLLFVTHDLDHSIRLTLKKMQREVEGLDENRLLNTPPEDLKHYLVEKYGITPSTLQRDQWYANHEDVPVDVRHDPMRWIDERSRPVMVGPGPSGISCSLSLLPSRGMPTIFPRGPTPRGPFVRLIKRTAVTVVSSL